MVKATRATLTAIYARLFEAFGPQKWWPAQTQFEVVVGAILTQNTNWGNVEKALNNLKRANRLSSCTLKDISLQKLALLIRPAGYFNVKAKRLKNFISFLFEEYGGNLKRMAGENTQLLRKKLLGVNGIGPETADSILLYAFDKPVFVVDAYTRRILYRHGIIDEASDYHAVQGVVVGALSCDATMFNEFHALIVRLGKDYCRSKPRCEQCVLKDFHYSLTMKCSCCHKALLKKQERVRWRDGYYCRKCSLK